MLVVDCGTNRGADQDRHIPGCTDAGGLSLKLALTLLPKACSASLFWSSMYMCTNAGLLSRLGRPPAGHVFSLQSVLHKLLMCPQDKWTICKEYGRNTLHTLTFCIQQHIAGLLNDVYAN